MPEHKSGGLPIARLLMVLGSLSPLFVLWAIRGSREIPDTWLISLCAVCVIVPNAALFYRWRLAAQADDRRTIIVRSAKDQSEHFLVYLFAMLIPLFGVDIGTARDAASVLAALLFVVFIFWHMNLHYVNVLFAVLDYNVFTVQAATSAHNKSSAATRTVVVLSKRHVIPSDTQLIATRLSDTVLIEEG